MTRVGVLFFAAMLIGSPSARAANGGSEADIRAMLDKQVAAWNRADFETFMETYWNSPKTAYVGANGIFRGWQSVLNRYRRTYPDRKAMGTTTFSDLEITMLAPDAALILGHWHLERASGQMGGVFSLVVRKFPEGWRIILDHTSRVDQPVKP
jgi:ketosteroid isomerase-like protein